MMNVEKEYEGAGTIVAAERDQISLTNHGHLLTDEVANFLAEVLAENPLPFEVADFQKLAVHAIGSLKNVVLISPTGSGKHSIRMVEKINDQFTLYLTKRIILFGRNTIQQRFLSLVLEYF